jgi:hypothetical protein
MSKGPLKLRELLAKLKHYGVVALEHKRGKGSEIILLLPNHPGSKQGPQYPIKNHGPSTEISIAVINAILRRFMIDPKGFWDQ